MSEGDDDERGGSRRSARYPKRERVTLKWESPPLRLPGEDAVKERKESSSELAIPDLEDDEELRPSSIPPPGESPNGVDGWERQRPTPRTPPPPRPPVDPPSISASALSSAPPLEGGALSLVDSRSRPSRPGLDLAAEMHDRYALGDYTEALRTAELILGRHPDHEEARKISAACRGRLAQLYTSRLGSLSRVPEVAIDGSDVRWLGLDHRAGFLLSRVDGQHTVEQLVDVSGMPRIEALKTLVELLDLGAIQFRAGR